MPITEQPATKAPRTNSPGIALPARAVVVTPELVKLRDLVTTGEAYACLPLSIQRQQSTFSLVKCRSHHIESARTAARILSDSQNSGLSRSRRDWRSGRRHISFPLSW